MSVVIDRELADLDPALRWREWMGRVEAAIFTSPRPVPRAAIAALVGATCVLDDLIADIRAELKARPYDLVPVAGGWHHRTRARFADAVRVAGAEETAGPGLSRLDLAVLAAVAMEQPIGREDLSQRLGQKVSRDTLAFLKSRRLIANGPRLPRPGAPATYVTTNGFLDLFGMVSLGDLRDMVESERDRA